MTIIYSATEAAIDTALRRLRPAPTPVAPPPPPPPPPPAPSVQPRPDPYANTRFSQGFANLDMSQQDFSDYAKFRASIGDPAQQVLSSNLVLGSNSTGFNGTPGRGGFYPTQHKITFSDPGMLAHETAHAYQSDRVPLDPFIAAVEQSAAAGNQLSYAALNGGYGGGFPGDDPRAYTGRADPGHVYTFFLDRERQFPGSIPPELRHFYKGLVPEQQAPPNVEATAVVKATHPEIAGRAQGVEAEIAKYGSLKDYLQSSPWEEGADELLDWLYGRARNPVPGEDPTTVRQWLNLSPEDKALADALAPSMAGKSPDERLKILEGLGLRNSVTPPDTGSAGKGTSDFERLQGPLGNQSQAYATKDLVQRAVAPLAQPVGRLQKYAEQSDYLLNRKQELQDYLAQRHAEQGLTEGMRPLTREELAQGQTQTPYQKAQQYYEQTRPEPAGFKGLLNSAQLLDTAAGQALAYSPVLQGAKKLGVPGTGLVQGFANEAARPTSIAAMALPLVSLSTPIKSALANIAIQGGANVLQDVALGRTDPKELGISAAVGGALGGLPDAPGAIRQGAKAAADLAATPEGKQALETLVRGGETGSFRPFGPAGEEPAFEAKSASEAASNAGPPPAQPPAVASGGEAGGPPAVVQKPEHAELITAMQSIMPTAQERKAVLKAGRARQFGGRRAALESALAEGRSAQEALGEARGAMAGDILDRKTLKDVFGPERVEGYYRDLTDAELNKQIDAGTSLAAHNGMDLLFKGRRSNGAMNPIMKHEAEAMAQVFGPEIMDVLPTTPQALTNWQKVLAPLQLWRSTKTAFDLGAMFRQGRKVIFSDPVEWAKASRAQFRALGQQGYERVMEQVHNSPHYALGQALDQPLGIIEQGSGLADEFLSPLTSKVPGLATSERTYGAFVNTVRQAIFDKNVEQLIRQFGGDLSNVPLDEVQRIATNINTATMFGNVRALGEWQRVASQTLFSARGLVSGPQFYADFVRAFSPGVSPTARRIIIGRTASAIGSDLAILGGVAYLGALLKQQGSPTDVTVDLDPFSQSLGDVRIGPVKWNPWGNEAQIVRALIQGAWGQQRPEGAAETRHINAFERAKRFAETKMSPQATILYDLFLNGQKDYRGRPIKDRKWQYAVEQAAPIMGSALWSALTADSEWKSAELLQGVGADVQVYGPSKTTEKANTSADFQSSLDEMNFPSVERGFESAYWQKNLPSQTVKPSDYENYDDYRQAYIDYWVEHRPDTISEEYAKDKAAAAFKALPGIKAFNDQQNVAELNFWKAHPDKLKEALDTNKTPTSKEKDKILSDAGLLP